MLSRRVSRSCSKRLAGDAARAQRSLEIAAELALEQAVHEAELLLFAEGGGVFGLLAAAFVAVHAGRIIAAFESLVGAEKGTP